MCNLQGREDILPDRLVVYGGKERYPMAENVGAIGLSGIMQEVGGWLI